MNYNDIVRVYREHEASTDPVWVAQDVCGAAYLWPPFIRRIIVSKTFRYGERLRLATFFWVNGWRDAEGWLCFIIRVKGVAFRRYEREIADLFKYFGTEAVQRRYTMEEYLRMRHEEDIIKLINIPNDSEHVAVNVSLIDLQQLEPGLVRALLRDPHAELLKWNDSLLEVQKAFVERNLFLTKGHQIKVDCTVRFMDMPPGDVADRKNPYPTNDNLGQFLQVSGNVTRITKQNFLEQKRAYVCKRCQHEFLVEASYDQGYVLTAPRTCPLANRNGCKGAPARKSRQLNPQYSCDYQEIHIQDISGDQNIPKSLLVTLENDLVNCCQPGDFVTVVGTFERRWSTLVPDQRTEVKLALRANSITKHDNFNRRLSDSEEDTPAHLAAARTEWANTVRTIGEQAARDILIQSICPITHGMYPVKLALALAVASCTDRALNNGTSVRKCSHLLLVGDPGLGKTQLLKFAMQLSPRAVFTTGMGCTAAGLTAAAVKEDGEWELQAGALVLADGGICCIDEFSAINPTDRGCIHEAMEQQTISMAKAGLVCKLSSRCVVLASANPGSSTDKRKEDCEIDVEGPLLSRFDLVLMLRDARDKDWDEELANHILAEAVVPEARHIFETVSPTVQWSVKRLQDHFVACKQIQPQIGSKAYTILANYYEKCRREEIYSKSRVTPRLFDSLIRLSQAHARLMFRQAVTPLDAITVIQLMESSWGFGKLMTPQDVMKQTLPLGPTQEEADRLLRKLQVTDVNVNVRGAQGEEGHETHQPAPIPMTAPCLGKRKGTPSTTTARATTASVPVPGKRKCTAHEMPPPPPPPPALATGTARAATPLKRAATEPVMLMSFPAPPSNPDTVAVLTRAGPPDPNQQMQAEPQAGPSWAWNGGERAGPSKWENFTKTARGVPSPSATPPAPATGSDLWSTPSLPETSSDLLTPYQRKTARGAPATPPIVNPLLVSPSQTPSSSAARPAPRRRPSSSSGEPSIPSKRLCSAKSPSSLLDSEDDDDLLSVEY